MRLYVACAFLVAFSRMAGAEGLMVGPVSIDMDGTNVVYRLGRQPLSLVTIQERVTDEVRVLCAGRTNVVVSANVVPRGETPASAIVPVLAALGKAGVRTAVVWVSKNMNGSCLNARLVVNLADLAERLHDDREFLLDIMKLPFAD